MIDKWSSLVDVLLALKSKHPNRFLISFFRRWPWRGHCHHRLEIIEAWRSVLSYFHFPLSLTITRTGSDYYKDYCVYVKTSDEAEWDRLGFEAQRSRLLVDLRERVEVSGVISSCQHVRACPMMHWCIVWAAEIDIWFELRQRASPMSAQKGVMQHCSECIATPRYACQEFWKIICYNISHRALHPCLPIGTNKWLNLAYSET